MSYIDREGLLYTRALAQAVKMAGGSFGDSIGARRLGYLACERLFDETHHELKLLLINAISADLRTLETEKNCDLAWSMALGACASRRTLCEELVPAVFDRVAALVRCNNRVIRHKAAQALRSLVAVDTSYRTRYAELCRQLYDEATAFASSSIANVEERDRLNDLVILSLAVDDSSLSLAEKCDVACLSLAASNLSDEGSDRDAASKALTLLRLTLPKLDAIDRDKYRQLALDCFKDPVATPAMAPELLTEVCICFERAPFSDAAAVQRMIEQMFQYEGPSQVAVALRALAALPQDQLVNVNKDELLGLTASQDALLAKQAWRVLNRIDPELLEDALEETSKLIPQDLKAAQTVLRISWICDRDGVSWLDRILALETRLSDASAADELVSATIDRLLAEEPNLRASFATALYECNEWTSDVHLALLLASSAHFITESRRDEAAMQTSEWLVGLKDTSLASLQAELVEPFIVTLLRLIANAPESAKLSVVDANVRKLSLRCPPKLDPLFRLYARCRTSEQAREALQKQDSMRQDDTVPEFLLHLRRAVSRASHDDEQRSSKSLPVTPLRYDSIRRSSITPSPYYQTSCGPLYMDSNRFIKHKRAPASTTRHSSHASAAAAAAAAAAAVSQQSLASVQAAAAATATSVVAVAAAGTNLSYGAAYTGRPTTVGTAPPVGGQTANPAPGSGYSVSFANTAAYTPVASAGSAASSSSSTGTLLSPTAKYAIIAAGGGVALIIACIGIWCCCKSRKKKQKKANWRQIDESNRSFDTKPFHLADAQSWNTNEKGWGEREVAPMAHHMDWSEKPGDWQFQQHPSQQALPLRHDRAQPNDPFDDERLPYMMDEPAGANAARYTLEDLAAPQPAFTNANGHTRRETGSVNGVIDFNNAHDSMAMSAYPPSTARSTYVPGRPSRAFLDHARPAATMSSVQEEPVPGVPRDTMDPRIMQVMTDAISSASQQGPTGQHMLLAAPNERSDSMKRKKDTIMGLTDAYGAGDGHAAWENVPLNRTSSKSSNSAVPRRAASKRGPPPVSANRQNRAVHSNYSGRVDSKPLRDLEEILDSFGPRSTKGESLPPIPDSSSTSSGRASTSTAASARSKRPPPLAFADTTNVAQPMDSPSTTHSLSPTRSFHPISKQDPKAANPWELRQNQMSLYSSAGDIGVIPSSQPSSPTKPFAVHAHGSGSLASSRDTSSSSLAVGLAPKPQMPSPPRKYERKESLATAATRQPLRPLMLANQHLPRDPSRSPVSPISPVSQSPSFAHSQATTTSAASSPPTPYDTSPVVPHTGKLVSYGSRQHQQPQRPAVADDFVPLKDMTVDPYHHTYRSATDSVYALYD